ncbi:MAG TPA: PQQ-binding-like beta-propeller repeat protein [Candidatus Dormibacteraeota bacterium]|nr:PQQ-binding-like beta-propeller repeat protein [Candidatus Dormibacteraeota bacterium]
MLGAAALAALITGTAFFAGPGAAIQSGASSPNAWTTFHSDNSRSGNDTTEPAFASAVAKWESPALDGRPYAEPLVLGGTVYVATMNDTVYAISASSGAVIWSNHLAQPVAGSAVQCFADGPTVGIQSTPVIDPVAGVLYAVGLIAPGNFVLYALDLNNSGHVLFSRDVDPPAPFQPLTQAQRPALALANGVVYVAFGGHDCGSYHGYIVAAATDNSETTPIVYSDQTAAMNGAPFWGASGPALDSAGNLYAATGNGFSTTTYDHGESVIKLSPSLVEEDHWAPANWASLNNLDADLGSMGPSLLNGGLLFQGAKTGDAYLLDTANLGGTGAPPLFSAHVCTGLTEDAAFGGTAYSDPFVYMPCKNGLFALRVSGNSFSTAWSYTNGGAGFWAGPPIVAGGEVWDLDITHGTLLGIDAQTGVARFEARVGGVTHFSSPTAAGGSIFVAVNSSPDLPSPHVVAYSMNPPQAAAATLHTTAPYAVLNTLNGVGGHLGKIAAGQAVTVKAAGVGPVPASATSVVVQLYATGASATTSLSIWPSTLANPLVPQLSVQAGATSTGMVEVPLGAGGSLSLYNWSSPANAAVVITGWRSASPGAVAAGRFLPEPPFRVFDTTAGIGAPVAQIASGQTVTFPVAGIGPIPASGIAAVSADVTAIKPSAAGALMVWAAGAPMPPLPSIEYSPGSSQTSHVYAAVGIGGEVSIHNAGPASVDVTADTEGAFTSAAAALSTSGLMHATTFQPLVSSLPAVQAPGPIGAGQTITVQVAGWAGIPASGVAAVVIGLGAGNSTAAGTLVVWDGASPTPGTAELSYSAGGTAQNLITVPVSAIGSIAISNTGAAPVYVGATLESWIAA